MEKKNFQLNSKFTPSIDQQNAINSLTAGLNDGIKNQVLLGVTGSGKTFTMANIIANQNRPTLVIAHNKTLAAQLCNEFREFFPNNRVEYFVSYYDYYQPEAYIVSTDTYIEKDMAINDEIEKLRNAATASLLNAATQLLLHQFLAFMVLATQKNITDFKLMFAKATKLTETQLCAVLLKFNTREMTPISNAAHLELRATP